MIPKFLYHYTTLETLKAIIESKKIRFNRLDRLNDPFEGIVNISDTFVDFRKKAFCSCWTPNYEENMLMWSLYTGEKMSGVRIKMNSCMFSDEFKSMYESDSGFYPVERISPILYEGRNTQTQSPITINNVYGPLKVHYIDSVPEIYEKVTSSEYLRSFPDLRIAVDFRELGIRKLRYWNGENEWRFMVWPFIVEGSAETTAIINSDLVTQIEHIDVPYMKEIEEIIFGPGVNEEKKAEFSSWLIAHGIAKQPISSNIKVVLHTS